MRKTPFRAVSLLLAAVLLFACSGCSLFSTDEFNVEKEYETALDNMLGSELYYWKETNIARSTYREANVMAMADRHFEPLVDEYGIYDDLRLYAVERAGGKTLFELWCGESSGVNKGDESKNYLFEKYYENDGKTVKLQQKSEEEPNIYYHSEGFEKYRLENVLAELLYLTAADMNFEAKNEFNGKEVGKKKKLGSVTVLEFAPTEEYIERYEKEHGAPSMFAGAIKAEIEITYENISKVAVYNASGEGRFSIEEERYKIEIVYDAMKKIDIPSYNETAAGAATDNNTLTSDNFVWKDKK